MGGDCKITIPLPPAVESTRRIKMVGGTVTDVKVLQDTVWIECVDRKDLCNIRLENNRESKKIKPGDNIWWQGRSAFWTPKDNAVTFHGRNFDIAIPRIGYSGVFGP
jgi:hypothetical protein